MSERIESSETQARATNEPAPDGSAPSGRAGADLRSLARPVVAAALLASSVIHFAYAPPHFDHGTSHGTFFLVAGWVQLVLAAAIAHRARPDRVWLTASVLVNAGIVMTWIVSRTVGVPGAETEPVAFPDALATGLEIVAIVAAAMILGSVGARRVWRPRVELVGATALGLAMLVSFSVVPSVAGGHTHGEGESASGHGHGGETAVDGHDHGAASDAAAAEGEAAADGHGDHAGASLAGMSPEDWEAYRIAELSGHLSVDQVTAIGQANKEYLAGQIRARSTLLESLPAAEAERRLQTFVEWSVDNALGSENGGSGGSGGDEPTMHSHGPSPWQPITDTAQLLELQRQLKAAGTVIDQFPTAADAVKAGYNQVTPYVPGIGAHYLKIGLLIDDTFDPAKPETLLYNGNDPGSELVGLSYMNFGREAPEGFVSANDSWHVHPSLCLIDTFVVGPDHTPEDLSASVGGEKGTGFGPRLWMAHLWQVPGWESPWGLFSGENPVLNLATSDVGK